MGVSELEADADAVDDDDGLRDAVTVADDDDDDDDDGLLVPDGDRVCDIVDDKDGDEDALPLYETVEEAEAEGVALLTFSRLRWAGLPHSAVVNTANITTATAKLRILRMCQSMSVPSQPRPHSVAVTQSTHPPKSRGTATKNGEGPTHTSKCVNYAPNASTMHSQSTKTTL